MVLKVVRPLYGISESGLNWYLTDFDHHVKELGMEVSKDDPCVIYRRVEGRLDRLVLMQADDTLGWGRPSA